MSDGCARSKGRCPDCEHHVPLFVPPQPISDELPRWSAPQGQEGHVLVLFRGRRAASSREARFFSSSRRSAAGAELGGEKEHPAQVVGRPVESTGFRLHCRRMAAAGSCRGVVCASVELPAWCSSHRGPCTARIMTRTRVVLLVLYWRDAYECHTSQQQHTEPRF